MGPAASTAGWPYPTREENMGLASCLGDVPERHWQVPHCPKMSPPATCHESSNSSISEVRPRLELSTCFGGGGLGFSVDILRSHLYPSSKPLAGGTARPWRPGTPARILGRERGPGREGTTLWVCSCAAQTEPCCVPGRGLRGPPVPPPSLAGPLNSRAQSKGSLGLVTGPQNVAAATP